ncbi:phBC6A51 family helix-turn-helix protein [Lysinibacillus sp. NPDC097214]|uniref:phBC6A51 family helix-turn-helix protein n=1 Tax=Lysinibacillus sp. NPDC097214 TaxID=3390584 RepID=UPI003D0176C8
MTNEIKTTELVTEVDLDALPSIPVENYDLTQRQLLAAQLIIVNDSLPRNGKGKRRSFSEIAADVGVSRETLYEYRMSPEFNRYIKDAAQVIANDYVLQALRNMKGLADGSFSGTPSIGANLFFLNHAGMGNTKQQHEITVNQGGVGSQVSDEDIARIIAKAEQGDVDVIDMPTVDTTK